MDTGFGSGTEQEARFAARVRKVRNHRGLSLHELAARAGLGRMALSNLEAGDRRITLSEACTLAAVLGVPLIDMLSPSPLVITERIRLD